VTGAGRSPQVTVLGILLTLLAFPFLLLAAWGVIFGIPTVAILAFTAVWLLLPLFARVKPLLILKLGISFMLIPAMLALAPVAVGEVDRRVDELRGRDKTNPAAFSFADKLGIYGLNIVMAGAAAPVYPEAAIETFLMVLPGPRNGRRLRVFRSAFGMGSARLRAKLRDFVTGLASETLDVRDMPSTYIEWDREEYRLHNPEARYALALNQTHLWAKATREGERWRIDVTHLVGIGYPEEAYVPLLTRPRLWMEEGLFHMLENARWLHRYNAEWRFTVYSDDKRLR
jgi:hypothetical protein